MNIHFHSPSKLSHRIVILLCVFTLILATAFINQKTKIDRSPEAEKRSFRLADPNLEVTLIATEPDVESPVAMSWGFDGELYVLEMPGYPTTTKTGRVKLLTDVDGDGRYTTKSIFSEGFDFPTGMMPFRDGLLIIDAPHLYFVQDEDHDGIAEKKEILITGFYEGNEQHRANALQWGLDNWIYGANGLSSGKIGFIHSEKRIGIDNRDLRFNIDSGEIEAISGGSQYGLAMDRWGNRFTSLNHRFARQVMLEERHLARNPSLSPNAIFDTSQDEDDRKVFLLLNDALRFNQDPVGYFTSLSGVTAYKGNLLGEGYENDVFAGESVQSAIIRRKMEPDGPAFKAIDMEANAEFLASTDGWFHPVNFSNGPDGALYVVDFYRRFVEHPQWANEKLSEGIDWQEGQAHGRIWRIARKDAPLNSEVMLPDFDALSPSALALQLTRPESWRREMAQQQIVEQNLNEAIFTLEQNLNHPNPETRVHSLWTLDGLKALEDNEIEKALYDKNPQVQIQAIKLAENRLSSNAKITRILAKMANDPNGLVRYHSILALGAQSSPFIQESLVEASLQYPDVWTRIALLSSVANWGEIFAKEYLLNCGTTIDDSKLDFLNDVGQMLANSSSETPQWVVDLAAKSIKVEVKELAFLNGYLKASKSLGKSLSTISETVYQKGVSLAKNSQEPSTGELGVSILRFAQNIKVNEQLMDLVLHAQHEAIRKAAILALASKNDMAVSTDLFKNIGALSPSLRKTLISSSLGSVASVEALFESIENGIIEVTEISEELRYALMKNSSENIRTKADQILSAAINEDRQAVVDDYVVALKDLPVDLKNGAQIFEQNCSVCHAINGRGGILAPDLTTIGNRSDQVLLVSILDPSRMVGYELKLHIIETKAGEVFSGTIAAETVVSYTIQEPGGLEHTILKENIKKHSSTSKSIMPEGFERTIDHQEMANLLGFLKNRGS